MANYASKENTRIPGTIYSPDRVLLASTALTKLLDAEPVPKTIPDSLLPALTLPKWKQEALRVSKSGASIINPKPQPKPYPSTGKTQIERHSAGGPKHS